MGRKNKARRKLCHACGQPGHRAADCPSSASAASAAEPQASAAASTPHESSPPSPRGAVTLPPAATQGGRRRADPTRPHAKHNVDFLPRDCLLAASGAALCRHCGSGGFDLVDEAVQSCVRCGRCFHRSCGGSPHRPLACATCGAFHAELLRALLADRVQAVAALVDALQLDVNEPLFAVSEADGRYRAARRAQSTGGATSTSLHAAASAGSRGCVLWLLQRGANAAATDASDSARTPAAVLRANAGHIGERRQAACEELLRAPAWSASGRDHALSTRRFRRALRAWLLVACRRGLVPAAATAVGLFLPRYCFEQAQPKPLGAHGGQGGARAAGAAKEAPESAARGARQGGARRSNLASSPVKDRICAIYALHNPDMLGQVDKLLRKHRGREAVLLAAIELKYGAS